MKTTDMRAIWAFAAVILALAAASPAIAQRGRSQVPRYYPQSPTLSPYLGLLSRNGSAAGNYFTLVRPLQRQQRVNEYDRQQNVRQQQELQQLLREQEEAFGQHGIKPTGSAAWFQEFGQNPPFQQTDHFYGQWRTGPGQSRTAPRRR